MLAAAALGCSFAAVLVHGARAQIIPGPGLGAKPQQAKPAAPPPPALPGTHPEGDRVTPAEKIPTDMPPNDALFDAINRGDIATARDAINRGAQIDARNILGMTPLELSVDLGRNNITFLLLSLRGSEASSGPPKSKGAQAALASAPPPRKAQHAERRTHGPVREAAAPAPQNPRLFAGDGGQPIPSAGFLGFGGGARSETER